MNLIDKLEKAGKDFVAKTGFTDVMSARTLASLVGVSPEQLQGIFTALEQPSLCFIPIKSENLTVKRSVDVGTTMLISQVDQTKDFLTDNSAPHPRVWTGSGYISSLVPYHENGIMVKPSMQVQMSVLDAAAESRQPVKFKTDMGEVVDVLVQDLQISATTKGPGVKQVSYIVQEVKVLENSILLGSAKELMNKAGAASIPEAVLTNLGKGCLTGSGTVNMASALLSIKF